MPAITLTLTNAGAAALAAAALPAADPVEFAEVGLTITPFVPAATLTALPSEFARLPLTGQQVSDATLHMAIEDVSADAWSCTGLGVWLADNTLFGTASSTEPLLQKAGPAHAVLYLDVTFQPGQANLISLPPITLSNPPGSEAIAGVLLIASDAEMTAGANDAKAVTPKKFAARIAALLGPITDAINTLFARTITGGGLATGGGDLTGNRTITVAAASQAETKALAIANKVVTPDSLNGLFTLPAADGADTVWLEGPFIWKKRALNIGADQDVAVNWVTDFPNGCIFAHCEGGQAGFSVDSNNPFVVAGSATVAACTVRGANNTAADVIVIAKGY